MEGGGGGGGRAEVAGDDELTGGDGGGAVGDALGLGVVSPTALLNDMWATAQGPLGRVGTTWEWAHAESDRCPLEEVLLSSQKEKEEEVLLSFFS